MANTRSNKNKGALGQKEVMKMIYDHVEGLEEGDLVSNPMGNPGEDIWMSPAARKKFPYQVEVKRKKRIGACRYMEQASEHGHHTPLAFFREDRKPWFVMMHVGEFFELLKKANRDETV